MRCNALLILGLCGLPATAYTQNQQLANYQDLITVTTQPPDAASLGKFGNVPVNYNTGATSITIPVFEITVGKTKLPISLDYHSGGIRVDETASSVGIGWALNGIGEVNRNVVGRPDDGAGGYLSSPPFDSLYNAWVSAGSAYDNTTDQLYAQYLDQFRQGQVETEPDIYSYTLNGSSAKFIVKKDGSILQFPLTNNVISQVGGVFRIVDPGGTIYIFNLIEHTMLQSSTYVGRWRLTEMIDPNTIDTIFFHYASACDVNIESYYNYTYSMGYGPNCTIPYPTPTDESYQQQENFTITTIAHIDEQFISEIDWRGGKITFQNTCDRLDKESEQRINSIDVYAAGKNGYQLTKAVQLYQSYFYSDLTRDSAHDERNYRLRLDSVSYLPLDNFSQPETYRMTYNTAVPMASRESMAQDQWGFNNGQFSNTTSIPKQLIIYDGVDYNIGEANRNSDSLSMLSCSIQSIQYPTGGKSVFEFEPHEYLTNTDSTAPESFPCSAHGAEQSTSQAIFTPDSLGSNYNIIYNFSSYNYTDVTNRPNITITDQVTDQQIFISSNIDASEPLNNNSTPSQWYPVLGHTYLVVVNIYTTTDANVNASITINWTDTYNVNQVDLAGGLRVKSVTNYDANGAFVSRDVYRYGGNESGMGNLITPSTYLLVNNEDVTYKCGELGGGNQNDGTYGCILYQGNPAVTYYANPVYPASQFSGSTILYPSVTKYQVDSLGNPNGKSIFTYSVFDDQPAFASTNYSKVGVLLITDLWRNGYLGNQLDYKYNSATGSYQLIHQKVNNYGAARQQTVAGLKLHNNYNWNTTECNPVSIAEDNQDFSLVQIPINSGAMLLQSTSDSIYDDAENVVGSTVSYSYNDTTHLFPTSEVYIDSKGNPRLTNLKYPHDFSATTSVYANMLSRNIISPVIQTQETYNGAQTKLQNVSYADWFGNQTLFEPDTVQEQIGSYPLETRIKFNSFDKYGNVLQQQKVSDMNQSYIWDYTSNYPIATVKNAQQSDIAFTSFEADGTGNWTIGSGILDQSMGITGGNSYVLNGSITKSGLNSSNTYIVSYWTTSNLAFSIPGTISGYPVKGKTETINTNTWTLYVHKVTGQSTITLTGDGHIDELRLYPSTAQMTTYTYAPLVGMTSQTDVGNRVTYYEYDGLARLKRIRDQDYNILKSYEYQYQVPAGCNGCQSVAMGTFLGTNTIGYPVGVFDIHGNLVGNAAGASTYVSLWNSDTADARVGTLSTGNDSLHFNIVLNAGQTLPASVTGCRYFQVDLAWSQIDAVRPFNGTYIDFGDSTGMRMNPNPSDTPITIAPNTTLHGYNDPAHFFYSFYIIHTYHNASLKTITCYHNDAAEDEDFDNLNSPAPSLITLTNLRGNLPANTTYMGGSCYQQPTMTSVANISNWSVINSIQYFRLNFGDGVHPCENISYPQDFLANDHGLLNIQTDWAVHQAGNGDSTFKISRLKSDWNTYFTQLTGIAINEDDWNHEDLSGLHYLNAFTLYASSQVQSIPSTPLVPLAQPEIDSILIQIAAGAGQTVSNGVIHIVTGGTTASSVGMTAESQLINKGWTVVIDSTTR